MTTKRRRGLLFLVFFVVLLLGYFGIRLFGQVSVPQQFSEARSHGAVTAQDIVNESNGIVETVNSISALEKQHKVAEALKAVATLRTQASDVRTRAIDLSKDLQTMNQALPSIKSGDARQAALDSISARIALISRLVSYTDNVNLLADMLEAHFKKGTVKNVDIQRLISDINGDVTAVNTLNSQAGQAMDRFDKIVR